MEQLWGHVVAALADAGPIIIALGFSVLAVWAFATGRVRVGVLVDAEKKADQEVEDEWKKLAQAFTPELKRLNDLLEVTVKLLLDPERQPRR